MNENFPPRQLQGPEYQTRRAEKPKRQPLSPEALARRGEIARVLGVKIQSLDQALRSMSEEQRKAIFYKVTHDGPITLPGTGLKALVDRSESVTLVIPRTDNLDALTKKLEQFAADTPKNGFVKNQDFSRVLDIELGDPKDRLSDEMVSTYDSLIKQPSVICEIEILSLLLGSTNQRNEIAMILEQLNRSFASGVHGTLFEHEERGGVCRAVIRCTGSMFQRLVEEPQWQRSIAWFEPKPRFETFQTVWKNFRFEDLSPIAPPPANSPTICIVDSGVTPGNPFLTPVTREDLVRSFLNNAKDSPYDEVGHGSGVASLAAYYAINLDHGAENFPQAWIASARILGADNQIEEDRLFSKVIEEVVQEFVPFGVRIFNLSVADMAKRWNQDSKRTQPRTSWTARTLDRLSREHDIVFVVSTGNIHPTEIRHFLNDDTTYPRYIFDESSRILDPSQAALAITVGSIAAGTLVVSSSDTAIAQEFEPSPFTRSGPGIKGEIKPELIEIGGNLVRDPSGTWVRGNPGTDVVMASHQLTPAAAHTFGTSFAAPRASHKLAMILRELTELGVSPVSAPLLKAFLIGSAQYRGDLTNIKNQADTIAKKKWLDVLGYGFPDAGRATGCDSHSIILFYQGMIEGRQVAYFDVPIPSSLADSTGKKRITVTTAHYPEVQKWGLESYLGVDLKWRMFRGDISREEIISIMSASDEEHEASTEVEDNESPNELSFEHRITRRSRGAVQHDWFEWTHHRAEFSDNHYTLAIGAYKKWKRQIAPVPYAVVVRIEDLGGIVPVYADVTSLLVPVRTQVKI
ncbi:MAG: S8 family peptidase [Pirellulaceae bacterium]|nr:S8 family peptidase [Pirellulaceae bacterium]